MKIATTNLFTALTLATLASTPSAQCESMRILPEGASTLAACGSSVALDGDRLVVGSTTGNQAWLFSLTARHGFQEQHFPGPVANGGFGNAVAIEDDVLVIGASWENAAYVFEHDGSAFVQVARLSSSTSGSFSSFGGSVALDGGRLVVGARNGFTNGLRTGVAFVFERGPSGWTETAQLIGSTTNELDEFGDAVDIEGDRIVVGAPHLSWSLSFVPGSVHVFELEAGAWIETAVIVPAGGSERDRVGDGVDLSNGRILIGASEVGFGTGELYLFEMDADGWSETARLGPVIPTRAYGSFGPRVALSSDGNTIIATSSGDEDYMGSLRIFRKDAGGTWSLATRLFASDAEEKDFFGTSLALDGQRVASGAVSNDTLAKDVGAAYVFSLDASVCATLTASPETLSAPTGGLQTLFLDAGPAHAGERYLIAGSASGTSTGTLFEGERLPLDFDLYTALSLNPGRTWLTHQRGVLDAKGQAAALLNVPAMPALQGRALDHAFVTLDASGAVRHVSNTVHLELTR